jgi:hypothetical protein
MSEAVTKLVKREILPPVVDTGQELFPVKRPSHARSAIAFSVAAISDFLSIWTESVPPVLCHTDAAPLCPFVTGFDLVENKKRC